MSLLVSQNPYGFPALCEIQGEAKKETDIYFVCHYFNKTRIFIKYLLSLLKTKLSFNYLIFYLMIDLYGLSI